MLDRAGVASTVLLQIASDKNYPRTLVGEVKDFSEDVIPFEEALRTRPSVLLTVQWDGDDKVAFGFEMETPDCFSLLSFSLTSFTDLVTPVPNLTPTYVDSTSLVLMESTVADRATERRHAHF